MISLFLNHMILNLSACLFLQVIDDEFLDDFESEEDTFVKSEEKYSGVATREA